MFGGRFGLTEILVILAVVLVLFGARRLPEIGSGLGKAIRNFKSGLTEKDELEAEKKEEITEGKTPS
ncbi:MAG: twin-arginine translocase TatA/TatE family subunit [Deltaproteobacteria bacterium]|nr:MAG: twin-arginine translocase TatA/TatE family subunit [Deltaproteobacteria bacterium]